jgi:beta-lysine 5,6-aminomutase alpha subunit
MADVVGRVTGQSIQLLGMMTEAMHNPFLMDRYVALKTADYVYRAWRSMGGELQFRPGGVVESRARETLGKALHLLEEVAAEGLMAAIGKARFGDVARREDGGKGLSGVVPREAGYFNPFLDVLEGRS